MALDGKTLRGSFDKGKEQNNLPILNACAIDNGLSLGQLVVGETTNENTAVPEILDIVKLKGATITADAWNTQTNIASKIVSQGNDYVLPVKGNQKGHFEAVSQEFDTNPVSPSDSMRAVEKGDGRINIRSYEVLIFKDKSRVIKILVEKCAQMHVEGPRGCFSLCN